VKEEKHTFRNHQTKNKFSNPLPREENQNKWHNSVQNCLKNSELGKQRQ
jgi:hypothetical protein